MKTTKWMVGLIARKPIKPSEPYLFIRAQTIPAGPCMCPVVFAERSARVAVRRYIEGNLSEALVCIDDGANEPATAKEKIYARSLRRRFMIQGTGPGGFLVEVIR